MLPEKRDLREILGAFTQKEGTEEVARIGDVYVGKFLDMYYLNHGGKSLVLWDYESAILEAISIASQAAEDAADGKTGLDSNRNEDSGAQVG